jgi:D-aminopeptidase
MKVHITSDMEGIATICHDIQADTKGDDFPRMREIMTGEVQAAIEEIGRAHV